MYSALRHLSEFLLFNPRFLLAESETEITFQKTEFVL